MGKYLYAEITERIIGAAFAVHNALGKGLSEKTYENALALKLRELGLDNEQQKDLPIFFQNKRVGTQRVDILVEEKIIVETKTVRSISQDHVTQVLGYLKNTHYQLALLINFGERVEIKRLILTR
ncbi:MAG: hypothetical protein HBSIN02_08940 [Bacteroidia bacterium]|nr:MAG: hypothetical protein HBSIN02_08940 [Bacteroidia bacterium]